MNQYQGYGTVSSLSEQSLGKEQRFGGYGDQSRLLVVDCRLARMWMKRSNASTLLSHSGENCCSILRSFTPMTLASLIRRRYFCCYQLSGRDNPAAVLVKPMLLLSPLDFSLLAISHPSNLSLSITSFTQPFLTFTGDKTLMSKVSCIEQMYVDILCVWIFYILYMSIFFSELPRWCQW